MHSGQQNRWSAGWTGSADNTMCIRSATTQRVFKALTTQCVFMQGVRYIDKIVF